MKDSAKDESVVSGPTRRLTWPIKRAAGTDALAARLRSVEERLAVMESAHVRFAELLDLVQELLLPIALRDEAKVAALLERFSDDLDAADPDD
ncbi:hypothetical protein E8D34_09705 [Nocardioides sp. GY 10113]|uniref:DUF6752 domain-containing protein n=1 Tax=Nocardioides sp. GY 10113 TaxID=2569761 RepID=UPI0010A9060B|nr:DUF6752 domain-containing protein [Nocardioides sp. GY 10113]TIC87397.1 hypothetical protein E8D34_09705 [Nocardioides sp. GY 10113]